MVELLADTAEIHWLNDNLVVVQDVVLCSIDRLGEPEGTSQLAALGEDLQGRFLPALLACALQQLLGNCLGVREVLLEFRSLFD